MQKKNKIVLFDIDRTIFDTDSYRKKLFTNLARELGLDPKEFYPIGEYIYQDIRKCTKYLPPELFLNTIFTHSKSSTNLKRLQSVFWDKKIYESCIYSDVKNVFSFLNQEKFSIGIFSTGDQKHQKIKVESLKEYLDENHIHIAPDKLDIIKGTFDRYKKHQTFLVDDFPQILENAKLHDKNIFTVFIKRGDDYPGRIIPDKFNPDASINNLDQLIDVIKNQN